jgi:hypothetical protein
MHAGIAILLSVRAFLSSPRAHSCDNLHISGGQGCQCQLRDNRRPAVINRTLSQTPRHLLQDLSYAHYNQDSLEDTGGTALRVYPRAGDQTDPTGMTK